MLVLEQVFKILKQWEDNMTDFKRMTLEAPVLEVGDLEIENMRKSLAERARAELGYSLFENHLRQKAEQKKADSLVHALSELEIKPLDTEEVEEYKAGQLALKKREAFFDLPWYGKYIELWEKIINKLIGSTESQTGRWCGELFISGGLGLMVEITALLNQNWFLAAIVFPFAFIGFSIIPALILGSISITKGVKIKEWNWKSLTFPECEKQKIEIPEFVIDTALRVNERIPTAQLSVEVLQSTERLLGDPFLVALHGGQKFYLDVWNESKFEGRRTV